MVTKLKQQLKMLEAKHDEAECKRDVLIARHRATQAQRQMTETLSTLPGLDSYSELDRMEKRIRRKSRRRRLSASCRARTWTGSSRNSTATRTLRASLQR